eukprot:6202692-Pleurochrysis_carterae.AAC.2
MAGAAVCCLSGPRIRMQSIGGLMVVCTAGRQSTLPFPMTQELHIRSQPAVTLAENSRLEFSRSRGGDQDLPCLSNIIVTLAPHYCQLTPRGRDRTVCPSVRLHVQVRRQTTSTSTGCVISNGRILTNAHCVENYSVVKVRARATRRARHLALKSLSSFVVPC